jgi:hypothetical protein
MSPVVERPVRSRPAVSSPPVPVVGAMTTVVGAVHIAITPLLFPRSVRSLVDGGVLGAVDADAAVSDLRALGFWYATSGVALVALGAVIAEHERRESAPPALAPWALAGLGTWGVLLLPKSPFWVLIGPAGLSVARRRSHRRRRSRWNLPAATRIGLPWRLGSGAVASLAAASVRQSARVSARLPAPSAVCGFL